MKSKAWFLQGKFWEFTDFLKFLLRQSSFCAIIYFVSISSNVSFSISLDVTCIA